MNDLIHLIKNDYEVVLTVVGILLILAGLVLFISGRYSDKESRMEGFGIKMDVKNPSLILIIVGVFLLITSATIKQPAPPQKQAAAPVVKEVAAPEPEPAGVPREASAPPQRSAAAERPISAPPAVKPEPAPPQARERPAPPPAAANRPAFAAMAGEYQLIQQTENGMIDAVTASMQIGRPSGGRYPFDAQYQAVDMYGNVLVATYSGHLIHRNGQWFLKIEGSNDPAWSDVGEIPMTLVYEKSAGTLGMRYFYNAEIVSVWQKVAPR